MMSEAFRSGPIGTSVAGGGNSQLHPILSLSFDTDSLWLARLASNFIPFSFSLFLPDQSQWVVLLTLRTECELSLLRSQVGCPCWLSKGWNWPWPGFSVSPDEPF